MLVGNNLVCACVSVTPVMSQPAKVGLQRAGHTGHKTVKQEARMLTNTPDNHTAQT